MSVTGVDARAVFTAVANFKSLDAAIDKSSLKLAAMSKMVQSASVSSSVGSGISNSFSTSTTAAGGLATTLSRDVPAAARQTQAAAAAAAGGVATLGQKARSSVLELDNLSHSGEQLWRNMAYGRLAAGGLAVAFATVGFAVGKMSIDYNKMIETQSTAFSSILQSTGKAQDLVKQIQGVAPVSPFTFEQLAAPMQKLLTDGFTQAKLLQGQGTQATGLFANIANAAAAQGPKSVQSLNAITDALGRMQSTGKVSQRVITELATAGMDVGPALQAALHLTDKQMQNIASSGKSVGEIINAVSDTLGKKFPGAMEAASHTFAAQMKNIREDLSIEVSKAFHGAFSGAEQVSTGIVATMEKLLTDVTKIGFMPALRQDMPVIGKGADALIEAFTRLKQTFDEIAPAVKAFVGVLAGAAFGTVVLTLDAISTALTAIDHVLAVIPGPVKEVVGAFIALDLILTAVSESAKFKALVSGTQKVVGAVVNMTSASGRLASQQAEQAAASDKLVAAQISGTQASYAGAAAQKMYNDSVLVSDAAVQKLRNDITLLKIAQETETLSPGSVTNPAMLSEAGVRTSQTDAAQAVERTVIAKADLDSVNNKAAVSEAALAKEAEKTATKTGGLTSKLGGMASALTGIPVAALPAVAGVAALVGAFLLLNKVLGDEQKAQLDVTSSADAMAKSLGISASAATVATSKVAAAAKQQTTFAQQNASDLAKLAGMSGTMQQATITQQVVTLKYQNVSDSDIKKFLDAELAALGSDKKFHVPIVLDTTAAKQSFDELVQNALRQGSNLGDNLKSDFLQVGGSTSVSAKAKGQIDSLAKSVTDAFKNGDIATGIKDMNEFAVAAGKSGATVKQQQADFNYFFDQVTKGSNISKASLSGVTLALLDAKTPAAEMAVVMHSLATSITPVIDGGINLSDVAKKYEQALKDGKNAADAMTIALKALSDAEAAQAAPAAAATTAASQLGAAFDSVYVPAASAAGDATKALSIQLDTVFTEASKQLVSMGDTTTIYSNQLSALNAATAASTTNTNAANTAAQAALQASLTAQQQVEEGALSNQRKREGAQLDALRASGQATPANLAALAATQTAAEKASSAQLDSIVTAQNAAKAQTAAAGATQAAAQQTVLSVADADSALQKQNTNIKNFMANIAKITAAIGATGADPLTVATEAKSIGAMDPSGGFAAKLAADTTTVNGKTTGNAEFQQFNTDLAAQTKMNAANAATGQPAEVASPIGQGLIQGAIAAAPNDTAQQIQDRLGQLGFLVSPDQVIQSAKGTINDTWSKVNQAMEAAVLKNPSTAIPDSLIAGMKAGLPGVTQQITDYLNSLPGAPAAAPKPGTPSNMSAFVRPPGVGVLGTTNPFGSLTGTTATTGAVNHSAHPAQFADGGLVEAFAKGGMKHSGSSHHAAHHGSAKGGGKAKGKIPKAHKRHMRVFAEGGMHDSLPNEAVIEPSHGAGLVQWAEDAAGPWEAFIPGAPAKRHTSLQIWKQVGQMLGGLDGNQLSQAAFAKGGVHHVKKAPKPKGAPKHKGAPVHHRRQPSGLPRFADGGFMEDSFADGGFMEPAMAMADGGITSGSSYAKHTHYHVDQPTIVAGDVNTMMASMERSSRRKGLVR